MYTHPEMFDENGQLVPDEILVQELKNNYDTSEDNDEEDSKKRTPAAPAIDSLPVNPFIFEIFDLAAKQKTNPKKVQFYNNMRMTLLNQ